MVALCAAQELPAGDTVPDWIMLLPAGSEIRTHDGRGPFLVKDAQAIVTRSLQLERAMVLDENHSTDHAMREGGPAPAAGWIDNLEVRADGIYGHVDWTPPGRQMMADKAYRYVSPAILHTKNGEVLAISRASLVNRPNLRGMASLHSEQDMNLLQKLAAKLGLADTTSEDALVAAVETLHAERQAAATSLQAQLDPIAEAAGLAKGATAEAVLGAIGGLKKSGAGNDQVVALQTALNEVTTRFNALDEQTRRDKATAFVDGAIREKKVGVVPAMRDHYITRHMQEPTAVEKEIGAMPSFGPTHTTIVPPKAQQKAGDLTPEQRQAIALMGVDPEAFKKTLAAEGAAEANL